MKTTPLRSSLIRTTLVAAALAGAALVSAEWERRSQPDGAVAHLAQVDDAPPGPSSPR